jgi:UDP-glucose 4-epimerase
VDNEFDLKFNVLPTIGLLDTMKRAGIRDIVFISSGGAVYGDEYVHPEGHAEDDVLYPRSAYGISKMTIEKYLHLYNLLYGFNPLIIRLSNPYGPYHYSRKQGIVNIALEKALAGEVFDVWGSGEGCKDYIYVEDFCRILTDLVAKGLDGHRVVNVGSGELLSVNRILETVREKVEGGFTWTHHESNALDVQSFRLNLDLLHSLLPGFRATRFEEGLLKTLSWYRKP